MCGSAKKPKDLQRMLAPKIQNIGESLTVGNSHSGAHLPKMLSVHRINQTHLQPKGAYLSQKMKQNSTKAGKILIETSKFKQANADYDAHQRTVEERKED